jgi:hypothetical protein
MKWWLFFRSWIIAKVGREDHKGHEEYTKDTKRMQYYFVSFVSPLCPEPALSEAEGCSKTQVTKDTTKM